MIQINTGLNTFIIDIYRMLFNLDIETFNMCRKILRNIFCNPNIVKIFHDCRRDCLILHDIINTCVINVFDTSAI
jgi:ribonuclease D